MYKSKKENSKRNHKSSVMASNEFFRSVGSHKHYDNPAKIDSSNSPFVATKNSNRFQQLIAYIRKILTISNRNRQS